ncbi:MAG: TIGR01621 family pseudouridine synthase [Helicobacteraceae bacterium]|jgi:tRNA pseudouridine32 synthase/23S rRNA pseudouridine746 synthase|nr:TIGR01621 family pseudouridine synthase [Helicobacteraceae bacterium]
MQSIELLFENDAFLLIDKPAGMNFHSEEEAGLVVQTKELLGLDELYPVHRLDKMTSGLVLFGKTKEAAQVFGRMFEERKIEKYYLAISLRKPKKKQGWVKGDMQSARRGDWMLLTTHTNPAVTQFHSTALREGERGFLVKPHTGKTHQIRVALKSLGSPIAGDLRYARSEEAKKEERGYLHAYALRFTFDDKEYVFVQAPKEGALFLSDTFRDTLLEEWSKPWEQFGLL